MKERKNWESKMTWIKQARFALMIAEERKINETNSIQLELSKKMNDLLPACKIGSVNNNVETDFGESPSYLHRQSICRLLLTTGPVIFVFILYVLSWLGLIAEMPRMFVVALLYPEEEQRCQRKIITIYVFDSFFFLYVVMF